MAKDDVKLKPCPFCGGSAEMVRSCIGSTFLTWVECTACGVSTRKVASSCYWAKDGAAELWNKRSADDE